MSIAYDPVVGKWIVYVKNGLVLTRDTEAEAQMADQKTQWIAKLQDFASKFYTVTFEASALNYEWTNVFSTLIAETDLDSTTVLPSTHTFDAPIGELTDSQLATVLLLMEYLSDFLTTYETEMVTAGDVVLKTASDNSLDF